LDVDVDDDDDDNNNNNNIKYETLCENITCRSSFSHRIPATL
jgi:hypothetical protein